MELSLILVLKGAIQSFLSLGLVKLLKVCGVLFNSITYSCEIFLLQIPNRWNAEQRQTRTFDNGSYRKHLIMLY